MEPHAVLASAASSKKPLPLSGWEKASAAFIVTAGLLLVLGTILWFGLSTGDWRLVSRTTTGSGSSATTTDYSDSIVVFAIATGAALMLAGAFYARLREIRLGPVTVGVGAELSAEKRRAVVQGVHDAMRTSCLDVGMRQVLTPAAEVLAVEQARAQYVTALTDVSDVQLADVGRSCAQRVIAAAAVGPNGGG